MKAVMGGDEFIGWQAYNESSPLDATRRLEQMIAQLSALIANVNSGKGGRKYKAKNFMPEFSPPRHMDGDQMLKAMDKFYNGI